MKRRILLPVLYEINMKKKSERILRLYEVAEYLDKHCRNIAADKSIYIFGNTWYNNNSFRLSAFVSTQSNFDLAGSMKDTVIASQCAHWRGNPPDFQTFIVKNTIESGYRRRLPHQ